MIIDAHVYYWSPSGMSSAPPIGYGEPVRYVEVAEAERLLEAAHRRGYERALAWRESDEGCGGDAILDRNVR